MPARNRGQLFNFRAFRPQKRVPAHNSSTRVKSREIPSAGAESRGAEWSNLSRIRPKRGTHHDLRA
ncbi:hypothetical protein HMPREF9440_00158 [Sutterella parvirubra YIT 11816]|uniref:Uncharacterized protein n=1 Tax=Sutterella parvirubra YIT 11816 TaxID=762967 RepID=H3KBR2_9BURK|nr:hypothetical protein HMPREF9440_00158 [Sutterella parvirubra YIT 11816]